MVYAPRIKKNPGSGQPKAPARKQPNSPIRTVHMGEHPKKPGGVSRGGASLYTRFDSKTRTWVKRTFAELNGTLPPKNPKGVKRGHDGMVAIEVGQRWMERETSLVVIVRAYYPSVGRIIYAPNREPGILQPVVLEDDLRGNFTPYDLIPD